MRKDCNTALHPCGMWRGKGLQSRSKACCLELILLHAAYALKQLSLFCAAGKGEMVEQGKACFVSQRVAMGCKLALRSTLAWSTCCVGRLKLELCCT